MPFPALSRFHVLFLALALVGAGAGCGATEDDAPASSPDAATEQGFPRTVTSKLGTARLSERPQRIVVLAEPDLDAAVALGVQPVNIVKGFATENGLFPWQEEAFAGKDYAVLDTEANTPYEEVAALRPDLVLAVGSYTIKTDYATLSKLAPTVGYRAGISRDTYQEQTRLVAEALGREDAAEQVLTDLDEQIAGVREEHPEFAGTTMAFAFVSDPNTINVVTDPEDATIKLLGQLGVELPETLRKLPRNSDGGVQTQLGLEQIDRLQADALVVAYASPQLKQQFEANQVFQGLPVVEAGGYTDLDLATVSGLREPTVLSIPYALDKLVAALEKAAA